jgi:N-acetylmuramoyl-L-alanine amidase
MFVCPGLMWVPGSASGGTRRNRVSVVDAEDLDIMCRTIWAESRGEIEAGKIAVGFVIKERARLARAYMDKTNSKRHALYGEGSVASACLTPWQFSCWNERDPNLPKLLKAHKDPAWPDCMKAAEIVLLGSRPSNVHGATHYCRTELHPTWARGQKIVVTIGHHKFYKLTD